MTAPTTASNTLPIRVRAAVDGKGRIRLLSLKSDTLQWLEADEELRNELQMMLDASRQEKPDLGGRVLHFAQDLGAWLKKVFSRDAIEVDPVVEEAEMEETGRKALASFTSRGAPPWLKIKPYNAVLLEESEKVGDGDVVLVEGAGPLYFSPDQTKRRLSVGVHFKKRAYVQGVDLVLAGEAVSSSETGLSVEAGKVIEMTVPSLPVNFYGRLGPGDGLSLRLRLGKDNSITLNGLSAECAKVAGSSVSLFVDMGSTYSKMLTVTSAGEPGQAEARTVERIKQLNLKSYSEEEMTRTFTAVGPVLTPLFEEKYDLAAFDKRRLSTLNEESLIAWLADAVGRFAAYLAAKEQCLGVVAWSFPAIESTKLKLKFDEISDKVTELTRHCAGGKFVLLPEHEALRFRFQHALHRLSLAGRKKVGAQDAVQEENERRRQLREKAEQRHREALAEYRDRPWWQRAKDWFTGRQAPSAPDWSRYEEDKVPTVSEFYRKFIELGTDKELNSFFLMDAGGFSLDVCGKMGEIDYGCSFAAGGGKISDEVRAWLVTARGIDSKELTQDKVEEEKRDACRSVSGIADRPLAIRCKAWTADIYGQAIRKSLKWLHANNKAGGVPLFLTGGAMYNAFLRELIEEMCREQDIKVRFVTAEEIAQIVDNNPELQEKRLRRFMEVTRGFSPNLEFDIGRDVCGGLLESFAED